MVHLKSSNHIFRNIEVRQLDFLESLLGGPVFLDVFANDVFHRNSRVHPPMRPPQEIRPY